METPRFHSSNALSRPLLDFGPIGLRTRGMSGFDLQERLTADGVNIPTIFITAHDDAQTRERVKQSGGGRVPLEAVRRSGSARPHMKGNLPGLTYRSFS